MSTEYDDISKLVVDKEGRAWVCGSAWEMDDEVEDYTIPPYLTINFNSKWYTPRLVVRDGDEPRVVDIGARVHMKHLCDYPTGTAQSDHAINPAAMVWMARQNKAVVPDLALEMLIGRWILEYHEFTVDDLTYLDDIISAGKRAKERSAEFLLEQRKVRDLEKANDALRDDIRRYKEEIIALKQEVVEAKRR